MLKEVLAMQLRKRQIDKGYHSSRLLHGLSDDEVIDCHVVCSSCGFRQIKSDELDKIIDRSVDADDFIDIVNEKSLIEKIACIERCNTTQKAR